MASSESRGGGGTPIRIRGLTKRYGSEDTQVLVFEDLDLDIHPGETVALVGESGAGKSTLLHLLGGLDRPTSGTIHYGERELTSLDADEIADFRNREIGFVWQTHYLLPEFTALENVMMPMLVRGESRERALQAARQRLEEVGLSPRAHHRSGELSGGEQQRVVIARALCARPAVLLADEPTGNLDFRTAAKVADLFDELHRLHGHTAVFVTHSQAFAQRCNRVLALEQGKLVSRP